MFIRCDWIYFCGVLNILLFYLQVEYDFKYYQMKMDADVQILILSEGKSNILPADLVLPIHPSSVGPLEIVDEQTSNAWRWYLTTLRSLPHSIGTEMQKVHLNWFYLFIYNSLIYGIQVIFLATNKWKKYKIKCVMQWQVVEDDMVAARQVDRSLGTEDLHRFVVGRWFSML